MVNLEATARPCFFFPDGPEPDATPTDSSPPRVRWDPCRENEKSTDTSTATCSAEAVTAHSAVGHVTVGYTAVTSNQAEKATDNAASPQTSEGGHGSGFKPTQVHHEATTAVYR